MESIARFDETISGAFPALREATIQLAAFLEENGAPEEASYTLQTVLEEIATNAIKYGFRDGGDHRIRIAVELLADRAEIVLEDDGAPFDPTEVPTPDTTKPLEEMPIGGLGIHLVRSLASGIEYSREGEWNRLRVWVKRENH